MSGDRELRPGFRILLIEDSPSDAELIQIYLESAGTVVFDVEVASTLADGLERIHASPFDVALVDLSLPDSQGIATCEAVRRSMPALPIIVLTGLDDEVTALKALEAGAQDYLVKGRIDASLLSRCIRYAFERQRSREQHRQSSERLRLIAEQLPAVLWTTDLDLRLTEPTTRLVIEENSPPPPVGMRLADYLGADDAALAAHRRAVAGEAVSFDLRRDGLHLSVHVEPLRDSGGTIIGTIGVSLDISSESRMREELAAARHVQQALFPHAAPQIPGFDIAGAAYAAEETAGDYFDFIPMSEGRQGLVIGDVTGHGLGPALLMAELRAYLRVLASIHAAPGEILMQANRYLSQDLEEHRFVTLFFARLDPEGRSVTCASAGHGAYVLRADGTTEELKSTGLPLGLIPDAAIETSPAVQLKRGDVLFIPTDGFQEAHTEPTELFGLKRTLDVIRTHRERPAAQIIRELYADVCRFVGSTDVPDDMSAIVVRCL